VPSKYFKGKAKRLASSWTTSGGQYRKEIEDYNKQPNSGSVMARSLSHYLRRSRQWIGNGRRKLDQPEEKSRKKTI
jgi:hypothetical protein